ncbi:MAG: hypothetical protein SWH54_12635 [Thermodesulfobacteriota bacterium]|nr:hypothetical protein [Thermodesulfobacteriota bacterium]
MTRIDEKINLNLVVNTFINTCYKAISPVIVWKFKNSPTLHLYGQGTDTDNKSLSRQGISTTDNPKVDFSL